MKKYQPVVPMFVIDRTSDTLIIFAREEADRPGEVAETLCEFRVPAGTLLAFAIWLGENKRLWRRWWRLGAAEGRDAIGRHVNKLWSARLGDRLASFDIDMHADRSGVSFVGEYANRTALIAVHRFSCVEDMEIFVESYQGADEDTLGVIFATACLSPPDHLATLVTAIVDSVKSAGRGGGRPPIRPTSH